MHNDNCMEVSEIQLACSLHAKSEETAQLHILMGYEGNDSNKQADEYFGSANVVANYVRACLWPAPIFYRFHPRHVGSVRSKLKAGTSAA